MHSTLWIAFGLMLVLEGLLPLFAPKVWRDAFLRIARLANGQLRFMGLTSIAIGLLVIILAK